MGISKNKAASIIILLALYTPWYFEQFTSIKILTTIIELIVGIYMIIMYITGRHKINIYVIFVILIQTIYLLSTYLNDGNILYCLKGNYVIIVSVIFISYMIKKDLKRFFEAFDCYFVLICLINTITVFLFSEGLRGYDTSFFLGADNASVKIYVVSIMASYIYASYVKQRITIDFVVAILSFGIFTFLRQSATGVVTFIILIAAGHLCYFTKLGNKVKLKYLLVLNFAMLLSIYYLSVNFFSKTINYFLFGKVSSLTIRISMWQYYLEQLRYKPIFGYGVIDPSIAEGFTGWTQWITEGNTHNTFIEVLYKGGVVAFAFFSILLFIAAWKFDREMCRKKTIIVAVIIFSYLVRGMMEVGENYIYILLILAYSVSAYETMGKGQG